VVLAGLQSELTHVLVTMVWSHPMNQAGIFVKNFKAIASTLSTT